MSQHTGSRLKTDSIVFYYDIDDYTGTSSCVSKIGPNMSVNGNALHRDTNYRQYLELDGSSAYLSLDNYIGSLSEITINAWISCLPVTSESVICSLNNMVLSINQNSGDSSLVDIIWYPNYSSSSKTYTGVTVSRRSHTLVSVTQDSSGNVKFYINGELKSSQSGAATLSNTQTYKHIGSLGGSSKFLLGAISRLIVNNEVLSQNEIIKVYKTNADLLKTATYYAYSPNYTVAVWNTDTLGGMNAWLPLGGATRSGVVDWGDGNVEIAANYADHIYEEEGEYLVSLSGISFTWPYVYGIAGDVRGYGWEKFPNWATNSLWYVALVAAKGLKKIPNNATSIGANYVFGSCHSLNDPRVTGLSFGNITHIGDMFNSCYVFNQPVGSMDVSNVQVFAGVFTNAREFNQPLNDWDTSSATNMYATFSSAWKFNQPLDNWVTSGVTTTAYMFDGTYSFDQDLSSWDVSNVTNMSFMFRNSAIGKDNKINLSGWDTGKVTNMSYMFEKTQSFTGASGLSEFNTSGVTDMRLMFSQSYNFNQDIGDWDVSNVTNMSQIFYAAYYFDQDLSNWDVSNVTNLGYAFYQTGYYQSKPLNLNVSGWDVSNATSMYSMFTNSRYFDENLGGWNLASLGASNSLYLFMYGVALSNSNYDSLLNGWNNNKLASANGIANWRTDLSPHFGTSKYTSAGSAARQALINYGWTITDGGLQT